MSTIDQAKELAKKGFHVFPCIPNSKLPAIKEFPTKASCDPEQVETLFKNQHGNIGISTSKFNGGSALIVVDVDKKDGRDGFESIRQLKEMGFDFPKTRVQRTPSGGRHLIYTNPTPVKHGTDVLGKGLDIRSRGSYIVGPGSVIDGKNYAWENDLPYAPCPEWIAKKCEDKPLSLTVVPPTATAGNLMRAEQYLKFLPPAEQGTRNHQAFIAAAKLKDFGLSLTETFDVMAKFWKAEPAVDLNELNHCVHSAFQYGKNAPGVNDPAKAFSILPLEQKPEKKKLYLKAFKECIPNLNQPYLIEGLLDPGGMSVIYGESNTGKSFFAVDMGIHIALGREWHSRKIRQGICIYVAAESGLSIERRLFAFRRHHGLGDQDVPFHLLPCQVDLLNKDGDLTELIGLATPLKPSLIVVDTLARAMAGGNENQSDHMGAFITQVDTIRNATGAHVMVVHHSGKDQAKGARGHSSLRAATDTEIEISHLTARVKKQRDREFARPIGFLLKTVEIGRDSEGAPVTSCVVEPRTAGVEAAFDKPKLTGYNAKAFGDLDNILAVKGRPPEWSEDHDPVVTEDIWKDEFLKTIPESVTPKNKKQAFSRAKELLIKEGYVHEKDGWCWIDYKPS